MSTEFEISEEWPIYLVLSILCVVGIAFAAGMTLGFFSIDPMKLKIKAELGTAEERANAETILSLLRDKHRFMCSLLVFNVFCGEILPVFMDNFVPTYIAVLLSVTLVLFFGEVMPAAIFTGPKQLEIAANLACFAKWLMIIFTPVALPLALLLDYVVGEDHEETLNRDELACMIRLTRSENLKYLKLDDSSDPHHSEHLLLHDEVNIMTGILELGRKSVKDIMVPIEHVHMVSSDLHLDSSTISVIDKMGRSRLPLYSGNDRNFIYGYLLVKKLITEAGESGKLLKDSSAIRTPLYVDTKQSLFDVLNMFQTGKAHIAIVSENANRLEESLKANVTPDAVSIPVGVITMEDIFEAMLKEQIFDEEDIHSNRKLSTSAMSSILMMLTNKGGRKSGISTEKGSQRYEPVRGYSTFSVQRNRSFSGSTALNINEENSVIEIPPQVLRNSSKS